MAEYSKEPVWFLKLSKDFFNDHSIKILRGLSNGDTYCLLYVFMMCESATHRGYLRYSKDIPYTPEMIASLSGINIDIVRSGIEALKALELITVTKDGSLFLPRVPDMTSSTTVGALKKAAQIGRRESEGGKGVEKLPPESRESRDVRIKSKDTDYEDTDSTSLEGITNAREDKDAPNSATMFLCQRGYVSEDDPKIKYFNNLLWNVGERIGQDRLLMLLGTFLENIKGKTIPFNKLAYLRTSLTNMCKSFGIDLESDPDEEPF